MKLLKTVRAVAALAIITLGPIFLPATKSVAQTPGLRVFVSNGVKAVIEELRPQLEQTVGRPLAIRFDTSTALKRAVDADEPFDVAIFNSDYMDAMVQEQKVASGSRVDIARSGLGVGVRAGAPKPDIGTPEAMKRTLLQANGIAYPGGGASTPYILKMFATLGITEQIKSSIRPESNTVVAIARVANGGADLLVTLLSEILPAHEVELVGPLPPQFQSYVTFSAAVGAQTTSLDAARALLRFFGTPAVVPAFQAQGMESLQKP